MLNFSLGFHRRLTRSLEKSKPSESTRKRRKSLFQHLQRTIEHRFKGSTLRQFGSSESGLSLSHGDLDLCLISNTEKPKKILRSLSKTLRNQDMEDIQVIASAKVPIIKFRDERTKIPVDISINNTLALHNTNLLKRYGELDSRLSNAFSPLSTGRLNEMYAMLQRAHSHPTLGHWLCFRAYKQQLHRLPPIYRAEKKEHCLRSMESNTT